MTGPVGCWHVADLARPLQRPREAGAQVEQEIRDVGGSKLIATVRDPDNNAIGLLQEA
jgi:predicted enzyme related to lactoylglutathione lyase